MNSTSLHALFEQPLIYPFLDGCTGCAMAHDGSTYRSCTTILPEYKNRMTNLDTRSFENGGDNLPAANSSNFCNPFRRLARLIREIVWIQAEAEPEQEDEKLRDQNLLGCAMSRRCLCDTIYPVLKLSQFTGIVPLSLKHTRNPDGRKIGDCQLIFKWKSAGVVMNTVLMVIFLGTLPFAYGEIRERMGKVFNGTDLYAFTFQSLAMVVETTAVLVACRVYKGQFTQGWQELNQVYHALCDSADALSRIKVMSYVGSITMLGEVSAFLVLTIYASIKTHGVYETCIATYIGAFYIQLTTLLPYILSGLFFFICLLVRSHFLTIADMIKTVVEREKHGKCGRLASQIDSIRVLHEQLCSAVKCFEYFFGVQVLLTLCIGCFTMVIGAYAIIIQGEGISSPNSSEVTTAWGCQLYCATVFILLILIAGQLVTNSATASAPVLNSIPLTDIDEQSQRQVVAFLNKISCFPTRMSAVNITTISTTFLASAATNITTYLLVLMQFKLTIENKVALVGNGITTAAAGFGLFGVGGQYDADLNVSTLVNDTLVY